MKLSATLSASIFSCVCRVKQGGIIVNEHTLSKEDTRLHVEVLSRYFDFIHISDLTDRLLSPKKRPFCLFTFDDGKRSNAVMNAPELLKLGVPAVFYLTTDFISSGTSIWCDRYWALVKALGNEPEGLEYHIVRQLPFAELMGRLNFACAQHGIESDIQNDNIRPMSWDDVRRLARDGFSIGAHGLKHAILTNETSATAKDEIRQSMAKVSEEIGSLCDTFAFPHGNHTRELAQYALECGARTVMVTDPTWVRRNCPLWRLPRIQLFGGFSESRIALKVAAAAVSGVLRNPDGTGRLYARRRLTTSDRVSRTA